MLKDPVDVEKCHIRFRGLVFDLDPGTELQLRSVIAQDGQSLSLAFVRTHCWLMEAVDVGHVAAAQTQVCVDTKLGYCLASGVPQPLIPLCQHVLKATPPPCNIIQRESACSELDCERQRSPYSVAAAFGSWELSSMVLPGVSLEDVVKSAVSIALPPQEAAKVFAAIRNHELVVPSIRTRYRHGQKLDLMNMMYQRQLNSNFLHPEMAHTR
jgi:hypothetical protein